jgi:hypothetical protein
MSNGRTGKSGMEYGHGMERRCGMTYTNGNDTIPDRTASYTIPQMASNNVVVNITGGCEYCMAEKRIMEHHGIFFNAYCVIFDGKLDVSYDNNDKDEWVCGHKAIKINYCPMCGRKLEVEG